MADEFKIVASLDIPNSADRINKVDIPDLEKRLKPIQILAELDTKSVSNIQTQLNTLTNQAKAPTVKIGVDTSGLNSVQSATQNITNSLQTVQTQAQQTANAVRDIGNVGISDNVFKKLLQDMQISKSVTNEYKQSLRALANELTTAWDTRNEELYLAKLKEIINVIGNGQKSFKLFDKDSFDFKEITSQIIALKSAIGVGVDGNGRKNKFFIDDNLKKELAYIQGSDKAVRSLLNSLYGLGNWTFDERKFGFTNLRSQIDKASASADSLYAKFSNANFGGGNIANFITETAGQIDTLKAKLNTKDTLNGFLQLEMGIANADKQLEIMIADALKLKDFTSRSNDPLGWFEEIITESEKVNSSLNSIQKEARETSVALGEIGHNFISNNKIQATFGSIKQAEEYFKGLNLGDVSLSLNKGSLQGLTDFTVKIKSATGEVERFRYAVNNIGDDKNPILEYSLTNINASNEAVQRLIQSQQKAQDKLKALRIDLASTLKSIGTGYSDSKSAKPIVDEKHLESLNTQYIHALRTIAELKNADDTTMASMKANAEKEIDTLKRMVKEYQNAEYVATSLRTKDLATNKSIQTQELDKFVSKISSSKPILDAMTGDINNLKTSLNNIGDATSFTKFLNELDIAKSKFESLRSLYQSIGGYDKQLDKLAQDWQKQGIYVGNVKTTVEGLKASLSKVNSAEGLTSWVNDFKSQIGAISELPVKIIEGKQKIAETSKEWYKQGILIKSVAQEMSSFKQALSIISTSGEMEQWNKNWNDFNQKVIHAKNNLDKQVESQTKIYEIQAQIAKLDPTKDGTEISRLNEKLGLEQKTLSNLQMQSNAFSNLISQEQQEQYITEQTLKARERLLSNTNAGATQYKQIITSDIEALQRLLNSNVFTKNASNPQVTQTKQDINSLITAYQNLMTKLQGNITPAGLETVRTELAQLNARFNTATATAKQFETELRNDNGAEKLAQRVALLKAQIEAYAKANPKAMKKFGDTFNSMIATLNSSPDKMNVDRVAKEFQTVRQEINKADLAGKTFFQNLKEKAAKFTGWMSMTYAISLFTRSVRQAVVELKDIDTILTEISKTSDRTEASLRRLGDTSFATASKYGQKASDYLLGVQEMSRAGFDEKASEQMAELSTLAQSAGDMTAELANEYLIATNAGYKFGGSAEKLNSVLDSQNYITNRNALNMSELAEATKIVASQASQSGIGIDKMTAAVGTMIATTQQGGEVAARAFKGILMNLQQVKGAAEDIGDGGEDITTESLTKYEKACADLGVSLKEVKDGVLQLRDPMQILEELANAVSKEAEGSIKVANLISAVGGKYRGNQLSALLQNWDTYSKMLSEFNSQEAENSAFEEAMKTANSWEGKLNELSNTWTDFINGIVNSDTAKTVIDWINSIIKGIDSIRDGIGTIPTILGSIATVGAIKNVGELLNTPVYAQPQLICA